jgi:hypothetical protein
MGMEVYMKYTHRSIKGFLKRLPDRRGIYSRTDGFILDVVHVMDRNIRMQQKQRLRAVHRSSEQKTYPLGGEIVLAGKVDPHPSSQGAADSYYGIHRRASK